MAIKLLYKTHLINLSYNGHHDEVAETKDFCFHGCRKLWMKMKMTNMLITLYPMKMDKMLQGIYGFVLKKLRTWHHAAW